MALVVVAPAAREDLAAMIVSHALPGDTKSRVKQSLAQLAEFPLAGTALGPGRWDGYRWMGGPWRWMLIVYRYDESSGTVVVVTIQDARRATAVTND